MADALPGVWNFQHDVVSGFGTDLDVDRCSLGLRRLASWKGQVRSETRTVTQSTNDVIYLKLNKYGGYLCSIKSQDTRRRSRARLGRCTSMRPVDRVG